MIAAQFDPVETPWLIERHQINWTFLVPAMMHRIYRLSETDRLDYDLSSLRVLMHGAAPCALWLKHGRLELRSFLAARLAGYKLPRTFERVNRPLQDAAGKVRRAQLRAVRLP